MNILDHEQSHVVSTIFGNAPPPPPSYIAAITNTYQVFVFHPNFNPPWQYFITSCWKKKAKFWPMDELIHEECHPNSYHSDMKYHMTLNIRFDVAWLVWTWLGCHLPSYCFPTYHNCHNTMLVSTFSRFWGFLFFMMIFVFILLVIMSFPLSL